jgi:mono/diheme cytochrome c family protein
MSAAKRLVFGCLVLVMAVCAWTAGSATENPGERVYEANCRRCHGQEGRGAVAPSLIPFDWSDEEALDLIRHPVCDMPPVPESAVSDAEVAQIVAYLKTIK